MTDTFSQEDDQTHAPMANAIRALSMDAVQKANSGHPGMPLGMADVATVLYRHFLRFDPKWPEWPNRDRFILSAGHGSMLLYSLNFLTGYESPTMHDIKNFRQLHSPTAGHPEYGEAPGIEMTTGPLGQGLATSVGFAIAERMDAARIGDELSDHYTYVIAGDGCLMEGVSHEAISMAGHLKLGKLIVLWDDNNICIDGELDMTTSDDQQARFEASNWHVQSVDGHDPVAIAAALEQAKASDLPSMIACKTTIGFGAPTKAGTSGSHGAPLGEEEIAGTRKALGWDSAPFEIPDAIMDAWGSVGDEGAALSAEWKAKFDATKSDAKDDFYRRIQGGLPEGFDAAIDAYKKELAANPAKIATRIAGKNVLEVINAVVPETIGGSADLTGSVGTKTSQMDGVTPDNFANRYMHYGVREFGMGAAMNGLALHSNYIPYGGTFLVFTDYSRPAIRLAALMGVRAIHQMTHDSIGLGEDGPTHQPVEHLMSLRAMPNTYVFRPADVVETAECWQTAIKLDKAPSIISLTRQGVEQARLDYVEENLCAKGGYILREASSDAKVVILATGSEVGIALEDRERLEAEGPPTRVVSMPCFELFDAQDAAYRSSVIPADAIKVSVEAGATFGWERYVGTDGIMVGMNSFGASAPAPELYKHFGITTDAVVSKVQSKL